MDFSALIKKSFEVSWHNRVLWLFGFLSGGVTGVSYLYPSGFNIELPNSGKTTQTTSNVLGITDPSSTLSSQAILLITLTLILIVLIVFLIAVFVSNWAAGALVFSILERDKQRPTFKSGARAGLKYWWKFWLLTLILGLLIFVFLVMLAVPALLLFIGNLAVLGVIYSVLAIIIFILSLFVISVVGSLIITISQRLIIHKNLGVLESMRLSGGLIKKYLGESALAYLIAVGLNMAAGFAALVLLLPVGLLLFGVFLIGMLSGGAWVGLIGVALLGVPALLLLFAAGGFWQAFNASYWTLFYEYLAVKEGW